MSVPASATASTFPAPRLGRAFGASLAALTATFLTTSSPIPLYNTYRAEQGLTSADITLTVVVYFGGSILSLLVLSRFSNHLGRKPVGIATMAVLIAGLVVLLDVQSLGVLLIGRFLMGLGAGLASSCLTAYIVDSAPTSPAWLASAASSQAPNVGLTLGAIGSGGLVEYGPWPRDLVYLITIGILLLCAAWIASGPETVRPAPGLWQSMRPRVHFPARAHALIPVGAAVFVGTWSTGAFFQTFAPALVVDQLGTRSSLVVGLVFASFIAPNVLGAPIGGRFAPATGQRVGMIMFLAGVLGIVGAVAVKNLPLFLATSAVAGAGQGIAISSTIRGFLHGSSIGDRAGTFGALYLIGYVGAALASLASGQLSRYVTSFQVTLGYAALGLLATSVTLIRAVNPRPITPS
ncbi:MAG: MFS transporter [Propionibacteriaceae bacterium]